MMTTKPTTKQESVSKKETDLALMKEMTEENVEKKEDKIEENIQAFLDMDKKKLKEKEIDAIYKKIPAGNMTILMNTIAKIKAVKRSNLSRQQLVSKYNVFLQKQQQQKSKPKAKSKPIYTVKLETNCHVMLNIDGIHMNELKARQNQPPELIQSDPYAWVSFNLLGKYKVDYKTHIDWLYDYVLVRKTQKGTVAVHYEGHSLEEVKTVLNQTCYQAKSGGKKNILNSVLGYYLNSAKHTPEKDTTKIIKKEIIYDVLLNEFIPSKEFQEKPFCWLTDIKTWYGYTENHFYEIVDEEYILSQIQLWCRKNKISLRKTTLFNGLLNLKLDLKKTIKDFKNDRYFALKNGLWDRKNNTLIDFDSKILNNRYIPRTYKKEITEKPELWKKLLGVFDLQNKTTIQPSLTPVWLPEKDTKYLKDDEIWEQYGINMAHFDFRDRLLLVLVGRPSAGKSPLVDIYKNMMGDYVSATVSFLKCGDKGELSKKDALKPVWVQNEMSMGYATNDTMKILKAIHSKDPFYTLRPLWMNRLELKGNKFMFGATNQAFRMSDSYNQSSSFKRICPLFCPNVFKRDTVLEEEIRDETFLDDLFSYLLNQQVKSIIDSWDEIVFWDRNELIWQWSAFSVKRVCKMLYERSYEINATENSLVVFKTVADKLLTIVTELPKKLNKRIKFALEDLGIDFRKRIDGDIFIGIKKIGKEEDNEEKKEKNGFTKKENIIIDKAKELLKNPESKDPINAEDVFINIKLKKVDVVFVEQTLFRASQKKIFTKKIDSYSLPE